MYSTLVNRGVGTLYWYTPTPLYSSISHVSRHTSSSNTPSRRGNTASAKYLLGGVEVRLGSVKAMVKKGVENPNSYLILKLHLSGTGYCEGKYKAFL